MTEIEPQQIQPLGAEWNQFYEEDAAGRAQFQPERLAAWQREQAERLNRELAE